MRSTGNFLRRLQSNQAAQAGFANDCPCFGVFEQFFAQI